MGRRPWAEAVAGVRRFLVEAEAEAWWAWALAVWRRLRGEAVAGWVALEAGCVRLRAGAEARRACLCKNFA